MKWYKVEDGKLAFKSEYKVILLVPNEHNRKISSSLSDFWKDMRKDEICTNLNGWIQDASTFRSDLTTELLAGGVTASMIEVHYRNRQMNEYVSKLFNEIKNNIEVRTIS